MDNEMFHPAEVGGATGARCARVNAVVLQINNCKYFLSILISYQ